MTESGTTNSAAPRPQPTPRARESTPLPQVQTAQKRAFADALSLANARAKSGKARLADDPSLATSMLSSAGRSAIASTPPSATTDAALAAQIERIAAAIAEVAATGANAQLHLSLPLGLNRIDGAILGRDAAGRLNVLLIPGSAVPPTTATRWSEQLSERLLRRDIRLGRVTVQMVTPRAVAPA